MNNELLDIVTEKVLSGKKFERLDKNFVKERVEKFFLSNGDLRKRLEKEYSSYENKDKIEKNKLFKQVVKEVRSDLGEIYGQFLTKDFSKKEEELDKVSDKAEALEFIKYHKSGRERYDNLTSIYKILLEERRPSSILDLGSGLMPLAYAKIEEVVGYSPYYRAVELSSKDAGFIEEFFKKFSISGEAFSADLSDETFTDKAWAKGNEMVFLFKMLDSIEYLNRNVSKKIIDSLDARWIVVSFPTYSIVSGKRFDRKRRNWFFKYLERNGYNWEEKELGGELFVIIEK